MKNSLFIGKISGIRIYIHWTFPLIILWIIFSNVKQGMNSGQIMWSVLFVLTLFVCITLHELGHAFAAKYYGIKTKDITLLPIGGVARLENMPENPRQELVVALAGPAVNIVIAALLYTFLNVTKTADISVVTHIDAGNFLISLAVINLWVALFNLIPALPMDGGRVLRALLSFRINRVTATRITARLAQWIAILFVVLGFVYNPFLILIGLFVFLGATVETEQVQLQSVIRDHTVESITMKDVPVLNRKDPIKKAVEMLLNSQAKNFLVFDGDTLLGTLGRDEIIKGIQVHTMDAAVELVTDTLPTFIELTEPVEKALLQLQRDKKGVLVVRDRGTLYGIVDNENVLEYIMVLNAVASSG